MRNRAKNIEINSLHGKLNVGARAPNAPNGSAMWECTCECGNVIIVRADNLRSGKTTSCGCSRGGGRARKPSAAPSAISIQLYECDRSVGGKTMSYGFAIARGTGIRGYMAVPPLTRGKLPGPLPVLVARMLELLAANLIIDPQAGRSYSAWMEANGVNYRHAMQGGSPMGIAAEYETIRELTP